MKSVQKQMEAHKMQPARMATNDTKHKTLL